MGCNDPLQNVVYCKRAVEIRRCLKASEHHLMLLLIRHQGMSEHRPPLISVSRGLSRLSTSLHPSLSQSSTSANHQDHPPQENEISRFRAFDFAHVSTDCGRLVDATRYTTDGLLSTRASSPKHHVLQSPPNSLAPAAFLNLAVLRPQFGFKLVLFIEGECFREVHFLGLRHLRLEPQL